MSVTDAEVAAFKAAWREADSEGDEGNRVRRGLEAAKPLAGLPAETLQLIRDLTDRDDCWFDHHGGCQAHGYLSLEPGEVCPHHEAKALLAGTPWDVSR